MDHENETSLADFNDVFHNSKLFDKQKLDNDLIRANENVTGEHMLNDSNQSARDNATDSNSTANEIPVNEMLVESDTHENVRPNPPKKSPSIPHTSHTSQFRGGFKGGFDLDDINDDRNNYIMTTPLDEIEQVPSTEVDMFMTNVYRFFQARGFRNIVLTQIINLLFVTFLVSFVIFLLVCVDISGLLAIHDPSHFYSLGSYVHWSNLGHMHWYMAIATTIFILFLAWRVVRVSFDIHKMYRMKRFYELELGISSFDLSTMRWQTVVDRMYEYNQHTHFYLGRDEINVHNIANRILKKENYMIAMINNNLFDFRIPYIKKWWDYPFLTTSMEWNLRYGVINFFFDDRMKLKREVLIQNRRDQVVNELRKRIRLIAAANFVFLPFIFMIYLFWTLFENGEQLYKTPAKIMQRTWNIYAKWKFRDFNELPHVLDERLRLSEKYAGEYMSQFTSHWVSTCAKFVSFIMSTFLVVLLTLSLLNDATLFNLEITAGKSVFWYMGILSTILLVSRALEVEKTVFFPKKKMEKLAKFIHYIPQDWIDDANSKRVQSEISRLFEHRFIILGKELGGMLLNPILMIVNLEKNIENIVDFIRNYTVKHNHLGHVCKFGLFEDMDNIDMMSSAQISDIFDIEAQRVQLQHEDQFEYANNMKLQESFQNFKKQFPEGMTTSLVKRYRTEDEPQSRQPQQHSQQQPQQPNPMDSLFDSLPLTSSSVIPMEPTPAGEGSGVFRRGLTSNFNLDRPMNANLMSSQIVSQMDDIVEADKQNEDEKKSTGLPAHFGFLMKDKNI